MFFYYSLSFFRFRKLSHGVYSATGINHILTNTSGGILSHNRICSKFLDCQIDAHFAL